MRLRDEDDAEGTASTTAPYCRDEVHGPLKGVGKEEVIVERNTVMVNNDGANRVVQEVREEVKKMTSSEENVRNIYQFIFSSTTTHWSCFVHWQVKADRGEI